MTLTGWYFFLSAKLYIAPIEFAISSSLVDAVENDIIASTNPQTLPLLQGINVKCVSERLAHTSIKMTLDTYSHVLLDMQEIAIKALDGIFMIVT